MSNKKQKILIIGLDGASWNLLNPFIDSGHMPTLKRLRDNGCHGILDSTCPPVTPAAWTSFMTGVHPNKHKVLAWQYMDFLNNTLKFANSNFIASETMWKYLSRQGLKVVSLNLPQTYPPYPINGSMVSGYGSPGISADITYPKELKQEILQNNPDYDIMVSWKNNKLEDQKAFDHAIECCKRSFENSHKLARQINDSTDWDVFLIQIQQTDSIQHKMWRYLTPDNFEKWPDRTRQICDLFNYLDQTIEKIVSLGRDSDDKFIVVLSDHGLGPLKGGIKPNLLLKEWGYLKHMNPIQRICNNLKKKIDKSKIVSMTNKLKYDATKTRAFVAHCAIYGFLYINVKGRNKNGIVNSGQEYDDIIHDLKNRFMEVKDPITHKRIFNRIATPEEVFGTKDDNNIFGDLILIAQDEYEVSKTIKGKSSFTTLEENERQGTHRPEGMYLLYHKSIKSGMDLRANIVDILPTIYAAIGVELPDYLDGSPLAKAFCDSQGIARIKPTTSKPSHAEQTHDPQDDQLTREEHDKIYKHLSDLGYLD